MKENVPILCSICGGWHATEAHSQFETNAREARASEIKARPDSEYLFDTLGFKSEKQGETKPWMHEVIEKAKNLGDDLQDSDFFIHIGPLDDYKSPNGNVLSVLSMIPQESLQESPTVSKHGKLPSDSRSEGANFVSEHSAGEKMSSWAGYKTEDIFVAQERWVQTRDAQDLETYKEVIRKCLGPIRKGTEEEMLFNNLDTAEGRRNAVKYISINNTIKGREGVGIVFKAVEPLSQGLAEEARYGLEVKKFTPYYLNNKKVMRVVHTRYYDEPDGIGKHNQMIWDDKNCDPLVARDFYRKFIHALYVPHGSVEEQRNILQRMLEITKDFPERRLPIYNFYGKLVWPKPSTSKKK